MPLCRDSAMIFFHFFLVFVKMCVARGWCQMPFCTLLKRTATCPACQRRHHMTAKRFVHPEHR